ncbi:MAG: MarR family winged helix-turn-helix transcriptional regulator [Syntrophomonadaceae bacterium]|jgi:DNA-binding MarR family transcriptional regulator|nr:MarR family transcriptional regulator [Bacillota bacterium]NLP24487.1 MarR family transcriptional regulator [Syntrophomonadaceae bacterium]
MNREQALELHVLLFTFMGKFHEKFFMNYRQHLDLAIPLKKNQSKIISMLYHHNGLTSTEIAKMLNIEKGGLTTIIKQLEQMGLVVRHSDPRDRRRQQLNLSEQGRQEMEQVMEHYTGSIMKKQVDEQELVEFMNSLRYVINFMDKNW